MNTTTIDSTMSTRERIERDRQIVLVAKLRQYPEIKLTEGPNPKFCAYVGPERRYVENYFITAVIAEIDNERAPRVTYVVTNREGRRTGELTPPPSDDNCFFFDVPLWNRKTGYVRHAVTVNGFTATPITP